MGELPNIEHAVTLAEEVADILNREATQAGLEPLAAVDAMLLLRRLRKAMETIKQVDSALVRHIYLTGEHGEQLIDGIGKVRVTRSRSRKQWDDRGVVRGIIDKQLEAREGEMPDDPWDVAEWILEAAGVSYWRVTPLRALHLDPKDYCYEEPGIPQVSLP